MSRYLKNCLAVFLATTLLVPTTVFADCPPWNWCQVENKTHEVGHAIEDLGNKAKDAAVGVAKGAATGAGGAVKILRGAAELATGHPGDAWASVVEGTKEIINGVLQVTVTGAVTAITMADPLIGTVFFGAPSPLQGFAKFIYDTISRWKTRPTCNPQEQINRLMMIRKRSLDDPSRLLGAVSTPAKYISSLFDGYGAWEPTGCDGVGTGRPVREGQISTDGLITVDVAISSLKIQEAEAPPGRYIRLEIFPGTPAHDSVDQRKPNSADVIAFRGPMMWDKDTDSDHPSGHMEMHPLAEIQFGLKDKTQVKDEVTAADGVAAGGPGRGGTTPEAASGPPEYEVKKGDNLSKIAEHLYGQQRWPPVFCANRKKIRNPDLIYPGQKFTLPIGAEEMAHARCVIPSRYG